MLRGELVRSRCGMVAEKNSVWRSFGSLRDDLPDVVDEAHVEHAVGFVEHEHLDAGRGARAFCWTRSSRRPGVATSTSTPLHQRAHLRAHRHAADDERRLRCAGGGRRCGSCRRSGRTARASGVSTSTRQALALGRLPVGGEAVEDRQREGGGLAGAGLRDADDIAALASTSGMVWAWIGVGVTYFSSARARRIGSARPKSLNEVKESLSYAAKRPRCRCSRRIRGVPKTSRVDRAVDYIGETEEAGRNSF